MTAKQAKIVLGATVALIWIVLATLIVATTRELRREVSDLADAHSQARILGFTGASFTGEQHVGDTMRLYESAYAAPTTVIAANTCANIDSKTIPNMTAGELAPIWQGTIFNYDAVDAAMNCDAGACSSFQTSMLAADFHGGGLCTMGGTICAGTDGGGLDQSRESWPAGGASPFGGTAHLVWSASLGEIQLQVCAGTQGVRAQGRISAIRMLRSAAVSDAGVADSGPADSGSDAADASDAGPAPTLSAITSPKFQTALGGGHQKVLAGTNLTSGCTATACGVSATVTCASTTATITNPAITALQSCGYTVTTPGGTATLATASGCTNAVDGGACSALYVWPADAGVLYYAGESTSSTFVDVGPSSLDLAQAGDASVPFVTSWVNGQPGFVPTNVAAVDQAMKNASVAQSQPDSIFVMGTSTNATVPEYFFDGLTARQVLATANSSAATFNPYAGSFGTVTSFSGTANANWYEVVFNTTCGMFQNNGTFQSQGSCGSNALGGFLVFNNVAFSAASPGGASVFMVYNGTPSSAERVWMNATMNAIY